MISTGLGLRIWWNTYDFNRIGVVEIRDHLKEIAEKENIKAEEQALHLIAQKADGALRDALSIFDLIATFSSDNSITYQSTIDNLHILDYDYYFKVSDYLNSEDVSSTLLLFDEILRLGFDGHDFVIGLSQHFRNLLICQDPLTLNLLEESESVKKRYELQAEEISKSFLLTAINISSQCDLTYKESRNQRLHVELCLMKMAHIRSALNLADPSIESDLLTSSTEGLKKKLV